MKLFLTEHPRMIYIGMQYDSIYFAVNNESMKRILSSASGILISRNIYTRVNGI